MTDPRDDARSGEWDGAAEVSAAAGATLWHIEFSQYSVEWPNDFALASSRLAPEQFVASAARERLDEAEIPARPPAADTSRTVACARGGTSRASS